VTSRFLSLATEVPEHSLDSRQARAALAGLWPRLGSGEGGEDGATRFLAEPLERVLAPRGLGERMRAYAEHATGLASRAASCALARAGVGPGEVDVVISVSCTGYMVPSLDAYLVGRLGLRADVLRLPITELGCSGGCAALALADRHLRAFPAQRVLVVAVELPSLTFQAQDRSLDNLTACFVFGDGAGAAVLGGSAAGGRGLTIEAAASLLLPDSTGLLGYDLRDGGFHVVLDRRLPRVIRSRLRPIVDDFRARVGLGRADFVAAHGGGPRILDAVQEALDLEPEALEVSRKAYLRVGNVSSASILFALDDLAGSLDGERREGLGIAFGPGVSVELMHLRWQP
jgi:alkylresorcinol/alkylpyrone synthase